MPNADHAADCMGLKEHTYCDPSATNTLHY